MKYLGIDFTEYREKPVEEHHDEAIQISFLKAPSQRIVFFDPYSLNYIVTNKLKIDASIRDK